MRENNIMEITKDMLISEALEQNPKTGLIFRGFGMGCVGCAMARGETIEQAAGVHRVDLNELLEALNAG